MRGASGEALDITIETAVNYSKSDNESNDPKHDKGF